MQDDDEAQQANHTPEESEPGTDPATFRRRRTMVVVGVVVLVAVAVAAVALVTRDDSDSGDSADPLEGLVYTFVSPKVPCCAQVRNEGTSQFTVSDTWRVEWALTGEGEPCAVTGRILDPAKNAATDLEPFGSGTTGSKSYDRAGTYSIALQYDCPPDSIAMAQVRVFDGQG